MLVSKRTSEDASNDNTTPIDRKESVDNDLCKRISEELKGHLFGKRIQIVHSGFNQISIRGSVKTFYAWQVIKNFVQKLLPSGVSLSVSDLNVDI